VNGDSWISFEAADRGMLEAAWMPSTLSVHEGLPDEPGCYYLSFADDEGWLGGVFVDANNDMAAYFGVTMRGLNPGGEVMILGPGPRPDDEFMNRLLSREDMERLDEVMEG